MQSPIFDLTICGLADLDYHSSRGVTHVLSILDPEWPEPESFWAYDPHHRLTLGFEAAPARYGAQRGARAFVMVGKK